MNYRDSVRFLYSLGNELKTAKFGLETIGALLESLGGPQRSCRFVQTGIADEAVGRDKPLVRHACGPYLAAIRNDADQQHPIAGGLENSGDVPLERDALPREQTPRSVLVGEIAVKLKRYAAVIVDSQKTGYRSLGREMPFGNRLTAPPE